MHTHLSPSRGSSRAFTLVELLVVIAILGILAGLLLASLGHIKDHGKVTQCRSNLHQIGIAFQLYGDDHEDRLPPEGRGPNWVSFQYGGGDPNLFYAPVREALPAKQRALWPYAQSVGVFHCPSDAGASFPGWMTFDDTFKAVGTSYKYNGIPWTETAKSQMDPDKGIAGKPISWIPSPSRFILLHEWPALPYGGGGGLDRTWTVWHFRRGPRSVSSPSALRGKLVSAILFVDGHAEAPNFASTATSSWPAEPTPDWMWYKPAR